MIPYPDLLIQMDKKSDPLSYYDLPLRVDFLFNWFIINTSQVSLKKYGIFAAGLHHY